MPHWMAAEWCSAGGNCHESTLKEGCSQITPRTHSKFWTELPQGGAAYGLWVLQMAECTAGAELQRKHGHQEPEALFSKTA